MFLLNCFPLFFYVIWVHVSWKWRGCSDSGHSVYSGDAGHACLTKATQTYSHTFPAPGPSQTRMCVLLFLRATSAFPAHGPTIATVVVPTAPDLWRPAQAHATLLGSPVGICLSSQWGKLRHLSDWAVNILDRSRIFLLEISLHGRNEM